MLTGLGQYMLYMLARLFTLFDALVYSIEGGHQCIKFPLSTYAYINSCSLAIHMYPFSITLSGTQQHLVNPDQA